MDFWWGFVVGLFIGANVGLVIFAVVFTNQPDWRTNEDQSHYQV